MKEITGGWKGESNDEFHIFHALSNIIRMEKNQENEMGGSYGTHEERNAYYKFGQENHKERGQLKNVNVNGEILILILIKYSDRLHWIHLVRVGISGGCL
jgi:hypothetical protein